MARLRRRPWGETVRRREWLQLIAVAITIAIALTAIEAVLMFFMAGCTDPSGIKRFLSASIQQFSP